MLSSIHLPERIAMRNLISFFLPLSPVLVLFPLLFPHESPSFFPIDDLGRRPRIAAMVAIRTCTVL